MVACSLSCGFNKQAFILIGKQNDGKSSFLRFLCPPSLKEYYSEVFNPEGKDGLISLCRNFIINLDELTVLAKTDIDRIKKTFAIDEVNARLPYDKSESILKRIGNFVGSTNNSEFLNDPTGSVRWLCFEIENINWEYSKVVNMDLVYSQAYSLFKSGFDYKVTPEELAENEKSNEKHTVQTKEMSAILEHFSKVKDEDFCDAFFWTPRRIAMELENLTKQKFSEVHIGKALTMLNIERLQRKCSGFNYQIKGYYLQPNFIPLNFSYSFLLPVSSD